MNLDVVPVKEKSASVKLEKRRDTLRVFWILWDSPRATLSGGYKGRALPI